LTFRRQSGPTRSAIDAVKGIAAGQRLAQPFEAWIAADPSRGGVPVLITVPQGFERTVAFAPEKPVAGSRRGHLEPKVQSSFGDVTTRIGKAPEPSPEDRREAIERILASCWAPNGNPG
jgi:hypothetical protein